MLKRLLVLILLCALFPIPLFSDPLSFIQSWKLPRGFRGDVGKPFDLAIGNDGDVFVTDINYGNIVEFNEVGVLVSVLSVEDFFKQAQKKLEVSNLPNLPQHSISDEVEKMGEEKAGFLISGKPPFVPEGEEAHRGILEMRRVDCPLYLALDEKNNIYISDCKTGSVLKVDHDGKLLERFGSYGPGFGQYHKPCGITVGRNGFVYLVETEFSKIIRYNPQGKAVTEWGRKGSKDGEFYNPNCVKADSFGNVYVVDSGNCRVQKFDSNGKFLKSWRRNGGGMGQFNNTVGIALGNNGEMYVLDSDNNRIQKFDSKGNVLVCGRAQGTKKISLYPMGLGIGKDGSVFVADYGNERIVKFQP